MGKGLLVVAIATALLVLAPPAAAQATGDHASPGQGMANGPVGKGARAGTEFRDCENCPSMVVIPAGAFVMGASIAETASEGVPAGYEGTEQPQHRVTIARPFAIGKFEVTRSEFARFVAEAGYQTAAGCGVYDGTTQEWRDDGDLNWSNPGFAQGPSDPVVCVGRADAQAYVGWLKRMTGKAYRLPTESEWEYAARAGTASARYFSDDRTVFCRYANGADRDFGGSFPRATELDQNTSCRDGYVYTAPVGSFAPNGFGLYDILGNVDEIVEDAWHDNYAGAPTDGSALPNSGIIQVQRGGSWYSPPSSLRAARRAEVAQSSRFAAIGFRVALTLDYVGL